MALPTSGQIAADQVNTELAVSSTTHREMNEWRLRGLAGRTGTGQVAFSDLYGGTLISMVAGVKGFSPGVGSVYPSSVKGAALQDIYTSGSYFIVQVEGGSRGSSFIRSVTFQLSGINYQFDTASAGYYDGGTYTQWSWPFGSIFVSGTGYLVLFAV